MRQIALQMARADTLCPASYWHEMPMQELFQWMETILEIEKNKPKQGK